MLKEVKQKLEELDPRVYYGMVDDAVRKTDWNYIVFNRVKLKSSPNKTGYTDGFDVHIIREDYIEDGLAEKVIEKMCEINGVRNASEDGTYNYIPKPNTNVVIEMLTLHFVRARKNV